MYAHTALLVLPHSCQGVVAQLGPRLEHRCHRPRTAVNMLMLLLFLAMLRGGEMRASSTTSTSALSRVNLQI